MKMGKYYLILAVVTGILCVPALGEIEVSPSEDMRPLLIGRARPELAGIGQLYVIIVPPDSEPNSKDLLWKELEEKVKNKLNKAGIQTIRGIAGNILNTGELRVYIDMLRLEDSQQYVFGIQTSLARAVYLAKDSSWSIKADVWAVRPVMKVVSVQGMPGTVTNLVLEQVEAFIHAWLAANPHGIQPTEPKTSDTVSVTTPKEPPQRPGRQAVAKHNYVASKNSKVFHRPDCSSAKRISPENLISYNSKNEAIGAGKRPCKICKP